MRAEKTLLRQTMREALQRIDPIWRERASREIVARLMETDVWRDAQRIGLFAGRTDEVDTSPCWLPQNPGKTFLYPKIKADELVFVKIAHLTDLKAGLWGLLEPGEGDELLPELVIVPGVAFDANGGRLGRGRGFYDRWLAANPAVKKVGICFECQMVAKVPLEPHDCQMDAVLTEKIFYAR